MSHNPIPDNISKKFTQRAKRTIERAQTLTRQFPVKEAGGLMTNLHLLAAIAQQEGGIGATILKSTNIKERALFSMLEKAAKTDEPITSKKSLSWSPELQSAITRAINAAAQLNHRMVGTEHLLYGIVGEMQENNRSQAGISIPLRTKLHNVKDRLEEVLSSTVRFPDIAELFDANGLSIDDADNDTPEDNGKEKSSDPRTSPTARLRQRIEERKEQEQITAGGHRGQQGRSAIDHFTEDLTEKARKGLLDPLIGRTKEVQRVINILNRRIKNNPVLIGEPGVGKTAIVYGLAQKIAAGDVPSSLAGKRILSLDLGLLVAGTIFRGEFEGRLKELIQEVRGKNDTIIFIDEMHTIVGAGSAQGSLDAANMLKPALADGSLRVIGATTIDEYRKNIEKDAALERRFQSVQAHEQTPDEALAILKGLKHLYEEHHNVTIDNSALKAAVSLSQRYITERFLPDKAIDLLDEAASHTRSNQKNTSPYSIKIEQAERELNTIATEKEEAIINEAYDSALRAKEKETNIKELIRELKSAKRRDEGDPGIIVTQSDIETIAAQITGIPLEKLQAADLARLKDLSSNLEKHILGQSEAISAITHTLRRAHAGLADPNRPLGSFLFLGPTGVGKTETARILAQEIFNRDNALIKLDMSEFLEPHSIARLIGAPPGYVGYEEDGMLTERVRRNPYSVILLDEIEKAHPKVYNLLLQMLEDGTLTSASGREVSFRNTIIIITSNIGTSAFTKEATLGFRDENPEEAEKHIEKQYMTIKDKALRELKKLMTPELLNRIDHTIVFRPLTKKSIRAIVELHMNFRAKRLKKEEIEFTFTKGALDYLANKAWKPNDGARPVRRAIEHEVENRVAEEMIQQEIAAPKKIHVTTKGGELILKLTK